jgi:DNA-binding transcriptional regulator YhcF (GntR family)
MSFKLVKTVIRSQQQSAAHKLVLIVIADHTNENKSGTAWPSVETIADYVGLKRRQVQRILRDLESSGQVKVWKKNAQMGTNRYQILVSNVSPMTPQRVTHDTPNVSPMTRGGVTHDTRVYKEQITKRVGGAPGPQPEGATALQQNDFNNVATVAQADAGDTPQCQEHKQINHQCEKCYAYEVSKWTQKGTA